MSKMKASFFVLTVLVLAAEAKLWAMDSTDLLPAGINSPQIRYGYVSGAQDRYNANGQLMALNDLRAIEFDVATLRAVTPEINELVNALNSIGRKSLGDELSLGHLHFDTFPNVKYTALIHAWGINSGWTLGVGLPVIQYENKISLRQEGSNVGAFKHEFNGLSPALDDALAQLSVSLPQAAQNEIVKKGYKPLANRNQTFVADLQLVSLYEIKRNADSAVIYKAVVFLPTGPKDDPDDLADLSEFGETAIENHVMASKKLGRGFSLGGRAGYRYNLPDRIIKRVPVADEPLPGPETKENLDRQIGGTMIAGSNLGYELSSKWSLGLGYEYRNKASDNFKGSRSGNYGSLATDTDSLSHKSRFEASYSTVNSYLKKQSIIPSVFSVEVSDTFAGKNTARQLLTELTLMLFY